MKKKINLPVIAAASLAGAGLGLGLLSEYIQNKSEYSKPKEGVELTKEFNMVAHRGFSSSAPENSLAAYRLAGEAGFKYAECDIRMTKDNEWILIHDPMLSRLTNGKGLVSERTLEEIKLFKYKRGANIKLYEDESIATLREFLEVCNEYDINPVIEIKRGSRQGFQDLIGLLYEFDIVEKAIIIDYSFDNLKIIRELCAEVKMMILCKIASKKVLRQAQELGNCGINVLYLFTTRNSALSEGIEKGIPINCWTVDSIGPLKKAQKIGATYVTTNNVMPLQTSEA